ncbi:hypothetical protein OUZ56_016725 [Daphnia magna]|uniref:Uncharacterized protein n=1 Tax=Daphnia magna TaxID=35525 RepID=A0ABR0ARC8_9CRUS|nr:hypothetical protein OUZ56_016725 [Daphnia magna]
MANKLTEKRIHQEIDQFRGDGILVLRNPFKAILSYRNFAVGGNISGLAPVKAFSQGLEPVRMETAKYPRGISSSVAASLVGKYRLDCVLRNNQDNTFKRSESGLKNYPKNPFTESQHLLILKSIQIVQMALKERGLSPLPVEMYDFYTLMYQYGHWNGYAL